MPGIRVQHPTQKSVRYIVVEKKNPYPEPYTCTPPEFGGCGGTHQFKTHHLNLDGTGAVILSTGVYERIKGQLALDGFVTTNEVARPPTLGIGMELKNGKGAWRDIQIVGSPNSKEPI